LISSSVALAASVCFYASLNKFKGMPHKADHPKELALFLLVRLGKQTVGITLSSRVRVAAMEPKNLFFSYG
jgi:hypothetical protein